MKKLEIKKEKELSTTNYFSIVNQIEKEYAKMPIKEKEKIKEKYKKVKKNMIMNIIL